MQTSSTQPQDSKQRAQCFERLLQDRRVPHGAFRLFHFLNRHADANGICWPGRRSMKRIMGFDFSSLQKWVGILAKTGWLRAEDYSPAKHPFVRERDKFMNDGMIYWLLNGDRDNPQPFGKVGTAAVREGRNADCRRVGTPSVRNSRNETYSNKLTPLNEEGSPPFQTQAGGKSISNAERISLEKELDAIAERRKELKNGASHDAWGAMYSPKEKADLKQMQERETELKAMLGRKY